MDLFTDPVILYSLLMELTYHQIKQCSVNVAFNSKIANMLKDNYFWQQKALRDYRLKSQDKKDWKLLYECAYKLTGCRAEDLLYNCIVYKRTELATILILESDVAISLCHIDWCIECNAGDILALVLTRVTLSEEMLHYYLLKYPYINIDLLRQLIRKSGLIDIDFLDEAIVSYRNSNNKPAREYLTKCVKANRVF